MNGVMIKMRAQTGKRDALAAHVTETMQLAMREPGTLSWTVHLSPVEADVVWLYEVYADEEARRAHETSAGYTTAKAQTGALLAGPPEVYSGSKARSRSTTARQTHRVPCPVGLLQKSQKH